MCHHCRWGSRRTVGAAAAVAAAANGAATSVVDNITSSEGVAKRLCRSRAISASHNSSGAGNTIIVVGKPVERRSTVNFNLSSRGRGPARGRSRGAAIIVKPAKGCESRRKRGGLKRVPHQF